MRIDEPNIRYYITILWPAGMSIHLFNAIIKLICQNMVKKNFQAFLSKIAPPVQKAHPFALHPGPEDPLRSCAP